MGSKRYTQLSVMMFLQFFVWGAWFVTLASYLFELGWQGGAVGTAYLTNNIGAIIAPFFAGMIADRFFASQKVAGVLHLIGAAVLWYGASVTDQNQLLLLLLVYNACYMSTLGLVNAISFNQMENPDQQFPWVRVWGTIGWIVAGLSLSFLFAPLFGVDSLEKTNVPIQIAAVGSVLLGLYCFTLPDTPPRSKGKSVTIGDILGADAFSLMKDRNFFIFVLSSLLISIPLAFYYGFTNAWLNDIGMENAVAKMSMGQMSEVVFMVLMPFFFRRLGVKWMLVVGMLAWVVRYGAFASGSMDMVGLIYLGILLHGICYDFFFVTGQIYVDKKADASIRASAQGFIALMTYGVGMGIGSYGGGMVVEAYTIDSVKDWSTIWWIPAVFAGAVALLFTALFNDKAADEADESDETASEGAVS